MKNVGWEIRPIGWVVIISAIGLIIYFVIKKKNSSEPNQLNWKLGNLL
jgi:hypothetical protein